MDLTKFSSNAQSWLSNGKSYATIPQGNQNNQSFTSIAQQWLTTNTGQTPQQPKPIQQTPLVLAPQALKQADTLVQQNKSPILSTGSTLSAAPQKNLWDQFTEWFRNTFTPDSDKNRKTAAQVAVAEKKIVPAAKSIPLNQLAETGGSLFKNSTQENVQQQIGIRSMPTNSEYTQLLMTGAIALGLVPVNPATGAESLMKTAGVIKGLVSFEAANRIKSGVISIIQKEGFNLNGEKSLSDLAPNSGYTVKTTLDVLDFLATGTTSELFSHKVLKGGVIKALTETFIQKVINKFNLPDRVEFSPKLIKEEIFNNNDKQVVQFIKDTNTDPVTFTQAALNNQRISIPAEKLASVMQQPYWEDIKRAFILEDRIVTALKPKQTDMQITPAKDLSPEFRQIETSFSDYLKNNYEEAIQRYNELPETQGGRILNIDIVRELNPSYAFDRSKSAAVHEPASAFTKKIFEDKLKLTDPQGRDLVLFTGGGTGAGKTTAINSIPEVKALADHAQLIYDNNMAGFESSVNKIELALKAQKRVGIAYVYREPVDALINGALPRAERMIAEKGSGRTVPLNEHLDTHINSLETAIKLAEKYKDNPNVEMRIIDNTHGKGGAVLSKLDFLKEIRYNKEELKNNLHTALNKEYEQNRISEPTYKGFSESTTTAETAKKVTEGNNGSNRTSNDKKPQQANDAAGTAAKPSVNKKLLSNKETQALQTIIEDKLTSLRSTAKDAKQYDQGIEALYNEIIDKSNGDKTILSALRTQLRKEMYGIAGASGNYKEAYATLKTVQKADPELGAIIDKFESYISKLDETLLSTPDVNYQKPANIQKKTAVLSEGNSIENYQNPVGTGKLKDSRFFQRLKESFGEDVPSDVANADVKYRQLHLDKSAFEAVKIASEDPVRAMKIADGLENTPDGVTTNQIRKTIVAIAREKEDWNTFNKYGVQTSLASTRMGQEIVSLRGQNSDHNPLSYVDQLVKAQKERIVSRWNDTLIKNYQVDKNASIETKFKVIVEKQAEKIQREIMDRRAKIQSAQSIINSLICK